MHSLIIKNIDYFSDISDKGLLNKLSTLSPKTTWWWWLLSYFLLFFISMDHRPPGSSARGISQARILRLVSILSFRRSIFPTQGLLNPGSATMGGGFFTTEPPGESPKATQYLLKK